MAPKKILIITGDFVEDYEIMVPYQALLTVGHQVDVVCPNKRAKETIATAVHDFEKEQTYTEKRGHNFTLTATFSSIKAKDYDALLIPGGRAPEYIRLDKKVLDLVREFDKDQKPIAALCHGLQVLAAAGVVTGRKVTGYKAVGPDLQLAGANFVEVEPTEVVVDGNLVTSPAWPGHPKWLAEFLKVLGTTIHL
jgi:protease I